MVDIRKLEEYKDGHVPGSLNSFYGAWAVKKGPNQNELPADDDLADLIGSLGINKDSQVVVIGKTDTPSDLVGITRCCLDSHLCRELRMWRCSMGLTTSG